MHIGTYGWRDILNSFDTRIHYTNTKTYEHRDIWMEGHTYGGTYLHSVTDKAI